MTATQKLVPAGAWTADPVHSSVTFEVAHLGVSTFRAGFADFEATLVAGEDDLALAGSAVVESIDVREPDFRAHLLSPEFFDVQRHPAIRFESSRVGADGDGVLVVEGRLTIRGTTWPLTATARIGEAGVDPSGAERIALELEALVDRRDFGLSWNMNLPGGKVAVGNDVRLLASLELVRAG